MEKDVLTPLEKGYYDFMLAYAYASQASGALRRAYLRLLENSGMSIDEAWAKEKHLSQLAQNDVLK